MVAVVGKVTSGLGRGKKFVAMVVYESLFSMHLGGIPFHGTLNLELDTKTGSLIDKWFLRSNVYENLTQEGKDMGGIKILQLILEKHGKQKIHAVGVRPLLTSHSSDVLEVVARENLREFWGLKDEEIITIHLENVA